MLLAFIFLLGIGNFAMHKAVIESRHPLLEQASWLASGKGQRIALGLEFTVLLAAMLLAVHGSARLAIVYLLYTGLNAVTAWLLLSGRV